MKYLLLTLILLSFSTLSMAHTGLKSSEPKNNAMLQQSPEAINLDFGAKVRLVKLTVENEKGKKVDIGFKPVKAPSENFVWELSDELSIGSYQVNWIVIGEDGHKMKGDFGFMVHAAGDMKHDDMKHDSDDMNHGTKE